VHAAERWRCCVEATATETPSASNWSSPATTAAETATTEASSHSSSPAVRATLRLPNQSRASKKRDPIEFSFHDFDFLCLFVWLFLKFIISLA
jgi:hypothetical protein